MDGCHDEVPGGRQCFTPDLFLPGAKSNFVHAGFGGLARFAKARAHAGEILQFQRHMLQNVCRPGAFLNPLKKPTAYARTAMVFNKTGQKRRKALIKARNSVGGMVFKFTNVNPGFNDRAVGPDIGTTQVRHPKNFNVFLVRHG
jgi:hypothetical protein